MKRNVKLLLLALPCIVLAVTPVVADEYDFVGYEYASETKRDYDRGFFFVKPGEEVYDGQVVGEHCKENDISVNPTRAKQLTNMRASGKDESARVRPPRIMSLEAHLEYIQEDELVEITPKHIRMRKRLLKENDRRRATRKGGRSVGV